MPNYSPGSDVTAGGWVAVPAVGGPVYAAVDEEPAVDTDYAQSAQSPSGDTLEVKYTGVVNPGVQTGHVIRYRIRGDNGTSITVSFVCGLTVIKQWVHAPAPLAWTEFDQALTQGEAAAISDYSDLRLRVTADGYSSSTAPSSKYRNGQPYLFQTVIAASIPSRIGGPALVLEGISQDPSTAAVGPTALMVDQMTGWPWSKAQGDILDNTAGTRVRNPVALTSSFIKVNLNLAVGNAAQYTYTTDVTAYLQFVQTNGRWNAMKFECPGGVRMLSGKFSANPPFISVTYVGGAQATLNCLITARADQALPMTVPAEMLLPVFMEFDPPTSPVQSATLTFLITQHWSGATQAYGNVLDPPLNTQTVTPGIAAGFPLDAGITSDPNIIWAHRYVNGTALSDFADLSTGIINTGSEDSFDPALYPDRSLPAGAEPTYTTAPDLTKWPHAQAGKWIGTRQRESEGTIWQVVPDSYTNYGFQPLAPGVGAMEIYRTAKPGMVDGSTVPASDYGGTNAFIYLPAELWGMDTMYVRYYIRLGTPYGSPYRFPFAYDTQVHLSSPASSLVWTAKGGKTGIMPEHFTSNGGVTNSSGGGWGWQLRNCWKDVDSNIIGPDLGGIQLGIHAFDYNNSNHQTPGYAYNGGPDWDFGQIGGLGGLIYADQWYCVEAEVKLNSVTPTDPGYTVVNATDQYVAGVLVISGQTHGFVPDGEVRYWVDGRKVFERTGLVFRSTPMWGENGLVSGQTVYSANPTYHAGRLRPTKDVGHKGVCFNWYHGGTTPNSIDRVMWISGLVISKQYIGPMSAPAVTVASENLNASDQCSATVGAALPSYVPVPGEVSVLNNTNGGLTNHFNDVTAPNYSSFWGYAIRDGDSGAMVNPYWGTYGATICHGAGHSSSNDNSVIVLEYGATNCTFKRLTNPPPLFGAGTDATTQTNNQTAHVDSIHGAVELRDSTWGEYALYYTNFPATTTASLPIGQKCASHTYGSMDVIPPANGGAANGTFVTVMSVAQANDGQMDSIAAHKVDFTTSTGNPGDYAWARLGNSPIGYSTQNPIPCWSQFVPAQNRIYYEARNANWKPSWFDLATNTYQTNAAGTALIPQADNSIGSVMLHVPERDLLLFAMQKGGVAQIRYMSVKASEAATPSWVVAPALLGQSLAVGSGWGCLTWCSDNGKLILGSVTGEPSAIFEIDIPAVLTNTWIVTRVPFGAGQSILWPTQNGQPGAPTYKSWTYNPKTKSIVYFPWARGSGNAGDDFVYVYRPRGT